MALMQLANHVAEHSTKPAHASMQLANRLAERSAKPVGVFLPALRYDWPCRYNTSMNCRSLWTCPFPASRYHRLKQLARNTGRVDATRQSCG